MTFEYAMRVEATYNGGRWRILACALRLLSDAHQVGEQIPVNEECAPCNEDGETVFHVETLFVFLG